MASEQPLSQLPQSMFAWHFTSVRGGIDKHMHFAASTHMPPLPGNSGSVLVRVLRASINPVDYKIPELLNSIPLVSFVPGLVGRPPATPGSDFIGRIVATGAVKRPGFEEGDLVVGHLRPGRKHGTLGEYITVGEKELLAKVDEAVAGDASMLDGLAGIGVAATTALRTLRGLERKQGEPDKERVFINGGSGGTGTYGIQIAKHLGLHVTTTCSARNEAFVRDLGADEVIDYTKCASVVDALKESVEHAGGKKFVRVVDNVGSDPNLYFRAHEYLAEGGEYALVGAPVSFIGIVGLTKMVLWPGWMGGGKRKLNVISTPPTNADLEEMRDLVVQGKVKTAVGENLFKIDEAPRALERLKSGRTRGKIVVRIAET